MNHKVIKGWLKTYYNHEGEECLWLDDCKDGEEHEETLTEKLDFLCDKRATVRYYTCDKEFEEDKADEYFIRSYYGDIYCDYAMRYSEYTGYLWTDEELQVGGHDILQELYSHAGEYILMIIEIDEEVEKQREEAKRLARDTGRLNELKKSAEANGMTLYEYMKLLEKER